MFHVDILDAVSLNVFGEIDSSTCWSWRCYDLKCQSPGALRQGDISEEQNSNVITYISVADRKDTLLTLFHLK